MIRKICLFSLWSAGMLWAMDPSVEMQIKYRPDDWIGYSVTRNMSGIAISENHAYFATSGGVLPYDIFQEKWERPFTVCDGLQDQNVRIIAYDWHTSTIWCVNNEAISYYNSGLKEWRNVKIDNLQAKYIFDLGIGKEAVWVEGYKKLFRINRDTGDFIQKNHGDDVYDQVQWAKRDNGALQIDLLDYFLPHGYFYKSDMNLIQDVQLREYKINSKQHDSFDRLFVATQGLGAGFANINTLRMEFKPNGSYIFDVRAMAWDGSSVWLGGHSVEKEEGGITFWDVEDGEWQYFHASFLAGLNSDNVNAIAVNETDVWFGTESGLARYNKDEDAWRTFFIQHNLWGDQIFSLALDETTLWIGTHNGLNRMDVGSATIYREKFSKMNLNSVYWVEPDGDYIWVGAEWGLYLYRKSTNKWQAVTGYSAMRETVVTSISAWDGQVWFGTDDGIEMYNHATGEWTGFPNIHFEIGQVISIMADHDVVWVGTTNGLLKYVKQEDRWHRYTVNDGLMHNTIQRILPDGDYVWVGTPLGVTRFYWNAPYLID